MTEKTAIDLIYEIHDMMKLQNEKIDLLNKQLSLINNKVTGVLFPNALSIQAKVEAATPQPTIAKENSATPTAIPTIELPSKQDQLHIAAQPAITTVAPRKNIRAYGHMEDQQGKPLVDAYISIMDQHGNVVKRTKSNRSGNFTAFLPPGSYSAEFSKEGMKPEFKVFELREGLSELEIT